MDLTDIVSIVRDITIIVVSLFAIYIFFYVRTILASVRRNMKNVENICSAISDRILGPATSGVAIGAWKFFEIVLGLTSSGEKKKDRDSRRSEKDG